jgi:hypothetical protein
MCFADDLILVAEAAPNQTALIRSILKDFCDASGQKLNLQKSQVFFSNNVSGGLASDLSQDLGIQITKDLGVYLGAPMLHKRASKSDYEFILDKMRKKLSGWKANSLSFAGRVTLAQSSLTNIPGYVIQSTRIPISVCVEAEKICRDFIWGSTADHRKTHLISWEQICRPKEEGGLGFKNLEWLNSAYMMKLAWQLITCQDKLWVKVMRAKYSCGNLIIPTVNNRSNSTPTWKAIVNVWEDVTRNITWCIQNGHHVRFWKDAWIRDCGPLLNLASNGIPIGQMEYVVSHYARDGQWNWEVLNQILPREICEKLTVIKPPSNGKSDFPCWNLTTDGNFSLKSAYSLMHGKHHCSPTNQEIFQHIWAWQGPNRYKSFLWKIAHDKILTNDERYHRGMTRDNLCPRCGDYPETIMHVLRDCEEAKIFWNDLISQDVWSKFFSLGLYQWLNWNITTHSIGTTHDNWQTFFGVAVYELWKDRNSLVFNRKSLINNQLLRMVTNQVNFIISSSIANGEAQHHQSRRSIDVSWTPPQQDHYKVNIDGSHKKSTGISTCGGLIRDSNGKFIRGFYNRLGSCSAVWAELWAFRIGIDMASQLNIRNVNFEMDSLVVVNMVNSGSTPNVFLQPLLQEVSVFSTVLDGELQSLTCIPRLIDVRTC